jgi:hypothetical protein
VRLMAAWINPEKLVGAPPRHRARGARPVHRLEEVIGASAAEPGGALASPVAAGEWPGGAHRGSRMPLCESSPRQGSGHRSPAAALPVEGRTGGRRKVKSEWMGRKVEIRLMWDPRTWGSTVGMQVAVACQLNIVKLFFLLYIYMRNPSVFFIFFTLPPGFMHGRHASMPSRVHTCIFAHWGYVFPKLQKITKSFAKLLDIVF